MAYVGGGYLVGYMIGRVLLIPIAGVAHIDATLQYGLTIAGGVLGAVSGLGWFNARFPLAAARGGVHGSAHFANEREVQASLGGGVGLIVGRENRRGGKLLHYAGQAHLLTIAPTRSGKGVGAIIPNLLTADRSVFCIDPKGENARVTARPRGRFGPVYVLDPFGVSGQPSATFNPLDSLEPHSMDLAEDAALLADALVHDSPGQAGEAHWNEEAKALIAGLILHVVTVETGAARNLARVRELLTLAPREFRELLADMQASLAAGGLVRRAANRHLGKSEREAAGVLSSAQRHTHFLDSVRINHTMAGSDFRFADLKETKATVFLVLPPERLDAYARWLRLLVAQAIHDLARSPALPAAPVLEFAALGRLEAVERAFGLMAGYGLQLWPILQDMHQLWSTYGQRAGTFVSNAGLVQIFNVADVETASWVSKSIGATTMSYQTTGTSTSRGGMQLFETKSSSTSTHLSRRELMTPDEIMRLDSSLEILLRQGQAPVIAAKVRFYADGEFRGLFSPA
ncbi:MAG: type IV secretory system conjugative DNA transfer family protein [Phenylobacterium sp.]|uniref:type IV secretory system conjugative DNA transfer family protein n=1 Tax=Phenylobacterium sp. TaxID=1871053 RepID=UPI001B3FAA19|nr:type IV secretory system conjugative DNA transfer family protein [Phenylobacterium sp.]MBP7818249.1 type IV secretory system conjugative DNA transfer family protein [Phenylobacterium sp.]